MPNVDLTAFMVDGTAAAQVIAPNDPHRKYISFQASDDACLIYPGEGTAGNFELDDGERLEFNVNITSKFSLIGNSLELHVFQDINSDVCLSSDNAMLTSDSIPIYYNRIRAKKPFNPAPIFS